MADTRWLDGEEQRQWRAFVLATRRLFERLERDLLRDSGMSLAYYEILMLLSEAPDRAMRMSELADTLGSSRSRLSHAVARLEAAGWVRRERCPTDRRGAFAVLTDEGFATLAAAAPAHVESVRTHLFDQLSPAQLDQLHQVSEALLPDL